MALAHDRDGFLVGKPVEIDTRSMARVLDVVKSLRKDGQTVIATLKQIRDSLKGRGPVFRGREAAGKVRASAPVATTAAVPKVVRSVDVSDRARDALGRFVRAGESRASVQPSMPAAPPQLPGQIAPAAPVAQVRVKADSPKVAAKEAAAEIGRQVVVAQVRAEEHLPRARGTGGRFISVATPVRPGERGSRAAASDEDRSDDDDPKSKGDGIAKRITSAITDGFRNGAGQAANGVDQVDPTIGAAKELAELASPLTTVAKSAGTGLIGAWRDRRERRKQKEQAKETAKENVRENRPWFRRILRAVTASGQERGGGFIGGLASLLGGGKTGGLLGTGASMGLGAVLSGALGKVGGLKGVGKFAIKRFPIVAAALAIGESFTKSNAEYASRLGYTAGESVAKDVFARVVGTLKDVGDSLTFGLLDRFINLAKGDGFTRTPEFGTAKRPDVPNMAPRAHATPGNPSPVITPSALDAAIVRLESGGRDHAKAPTSSATGAGQFTRSTWLATIRKHRPDIAAGKSDDQLLAMRTDGALSRQMVAAYRQDNAAHLAKHGIAPAAQNLYAAHHFGPAGAVRYAQASDDAHVSEFLTRGQIGANPYLRNMTKAQLTQHWAGRGLPVGAVVSASALPPSGTTGAAGAAASPAALPVPGASARAVVPAATPSPALRAPVVGAAPGRIASAIPPAPPVSTVVGSNAQGDKPVSVIIPEQLGQNLTDRGIANLATGGMGGNRIGGLA